MLSLWLEEGVEEADLEVKREVQQKKEEKKASCACGRTVCCGKHKNGQCSCYKGRERD